MENSSGSADEGVSLESSRAATRARHIVDHAFGREGTTEPPGFDLWPRRARAKAITGTPEGAARRSASRVGLFRRLLRRVGILGALHREGADWPGGHVETDLFSTN